MPKSKPTLRTMTAPVTRAMVFICQKCGKRAGGSAKHASAVLASNFKRAAKTEFGKGTVRVVLTSCMDLCPDEAIAVSLQTLVGSGAPVFIEADLDDIEKASQALVERLRQVTAI